MLYHLLTYIFHYISLRSRAIRRLVTFWSFWIFFGGKNFVNQPTTGLSIHATHGLTIARMSSISARALVWAASLVYLLRPAQRGWPFRMLRCGFLCCCIINQQGFTCWSITVGHCLKFRSLRDPTWYAKYYAKAATRYSQQLAKTSQPSKNQNSWPLGQSKSGSCGQWKKIQ